MYNKTRKYSKIKLKWMLNVNTKVSDTEKWFSHKIEWMTNGR